MPSRIVNPLPWFLRRSIILKFLISEDSFFATSIVLSLGPSVAITISYEKGFVAKYSCNLFIIVLYCEPGDFGRDALSSCEGCRTRKLIFGKLFFRGSEISSTIFPFWLKEFYGVEQNVRYYALKIPVVVDVFGFIGTGKERSCTRATRVEIHRVCGEYFLHEL